MEQERLPRDGDREIFQRVWRRVMPEQGEDCPLELADPEPEPGPLPPAIPVMAPPAAETCGCLGEDSAVYGQRLQAFIDRALTAWRCYQTLARRIQRGGGRTLATLAADERRHARRLSAAYFLISGVRYWPADQVSAPAAGPLLSALRECFQAERLSAAAYRAAAEGVSDSCLAGLFQELGQEEESHAWLIRTLLEQQL